MESSLGGFCGDAPDAGLPPGAIARFVVGQEPNQTSAAFAPDGKSLAATNGHRVARWDTITGRRLSEFGGYGWLDYSPDGKYLAINREGEFQLTDLSGPEPAFPPGKYKWRERTAFSPDSKLIALATVAIDISVYSLPQFQLVATLGKVPPLTNDWYSGIDFSHDGKHLYATYHGKMYTYDALTGNLSGDAVSIGDGSRTILSPVSEPLAQVDEGKATVQIFDIAARKSADAI